MKEKLSVLIESLKEIEEIDKMEEEWFLSVTDLGRREFLKGEVVNKMHMEAILWKQKARERWLKEDDRNARYVLCMAIHRRCRYVEELLIGSHIIKRNNDMREQACGYFQQLYEEEVRSRPRLDNLKVR